MGGKAIERMGQVNNRISALVNVEDLVVAYGRPIEKRPEIPREILIVFFEKIPEHVQVQSFSETPWSRQQHFISGDR